MMRRFLQDWPQEGLAISGFMAFAIVGSLIFDGWEFGNDTRTIGLAIFVVCFSCTFFYRMGYRSQQEEIDYWTNSALIQEPVLTQRLYAQRFGEEVMKTRLEQALSRRQEHPPMYP